MERMNGMKTIPLGVLMDAMGKLATQADALRMQQFLFGRGIEDLATVSEGEWLCLMDDALRNGEPSFYALVYDCDGDEVARWPLGDDDPLDCDVYAGWFAQQIGAELVPKSPRGMAIPDGCEDYRVVLQEEPGAARCWKSANYMLEGTL